MSSQSPDVPPQPVLPESWEQLASTVPPASSVLPLSSSLPPPSSDAPPPSSDVPAPVPALAPKKKMMRLNPNASSFIPAPTPVAPVEPPPSFVPTSFPPSSYPPTFDMLGGGYGGGGYYNGSFPGFPNMPQNMGFMPVYNQNEMVVDEQTGFAKFGKGEDDDEEEERDDKFVDTEKLKKERDDKKKKKKEENIAKQEELKKIAIEKAIKKREEKKKEEGKPEPPKKKKIEEKDDLEINEAELSKFTEVDESRAPVNIVFIGHVDAGKSTICGSILLMTGKVDKAELRKLEIEAKEQKRESWYLAYIMDINKEERAKGKTVEVGKAHFQTQTKRFTILDAPGHKNYVPNMIAGCSQADYAALVISAKQGEFESGFEKGGQTAEHAMLARSLGVSKLIVLVNKMDEVNWEEKRFTYIKEQFEPYLKEACGFDNKDIEWIPMSGLLGINMNSLLSPELCPWYKGPCLFDLLDHLPCPERNPSGPLRIPVFDKMRDLGLYVFGKVESGTLVTDMNLMLMPYKKEFQVSHIYNTEDKRVKYAKPGENIKMKVKGIEDEELKRGYMISEQESMCPVTMEFEASITILELPESTPILSQGSKSVIHMHTMTEEIQINKIISYYDKEKQKQINTSFLKNGMNGIVRLASASVLCIEKIDTNAHLGKFTLRDKGRTIAYGEVLRIKPLSKSVVPVQAAAPVEPAEKTEVQVTEVKAEEQKESETI